MCVYESKVTMFEMLNNIITSCGSQLLANDCDRFVLVGHTINEDNDYVRPMLVGYNVGLHKVDYVKCWTINKKYMAWSPGTV